MSHFGVTLMPIKPPRLYVRAHGIFYLRIVTPKSMQAITGKRETWRSLRTKDPQQAKVYALTYALETEKAKLTMASKKDNLTDLLQQTTKPLTTNIDRLLTT